ncbi:MAG: hypothetical protein ABW098_01530 [Candidatus Thiodiazotropha sp.]
MKDNDKYTALVIENEGKQAKDKLISSLIQSDLFDKCYAYKSRVKSEKKLLEKKIRKRAKKPHYELEDITDVIGIRLVTLFKSDMPKVFNELLRIISHKTLQPNPFKPNSLKEVIVYHTGQYDETTTNIKHCLEELSDLPKDYIFDAQQSKEGYSSIHIVAYLSYAVRKIENYDMPIEIQIRTVFEDAWGEIDHQYGYVIREGKSSTKPIHNAEHVLQHLKILKKFSDACSEYADAIHEEALFSDGEKTTPGKVISVSADNALIEQFKNMNVSEGMISKYVEARERRIQGQRTLDNDRKNGIKMLLEAAECFREIGPEFPPDGAYEPNNKDHIFHYYVKMNEAVCLLSTNIKENIKQALHLYTDLESWNSNFLILHLRIGQALGKLGKRRQAAEKYEYVRKVVKTVNADREVWDNYLPEVDYNHIQNHLGTLLGYQYWKMSCDINDTEQSSVQKKAKFLESAFSVTEEQDSWHVDNSDNDQACKTVNNMLYYALEMYQLDKEHNLCHDNITDKIEDMCTRFEKCIDAETCDDIEYLDTLAKAYTHINKSESALNALNKILDLSLTKENEGLIDDSVVLRLAQEAYEMRQKLVNGNPQE